MSQTRWLATVVISVAAFGAWLRSRWPSSESWLDCPPSAIHWVDAGGQLLARCGIGEVARSVAVPAPMRLAVGAKLDLNHASEAELAVVPGVGKHLANALVEFRQHHGAFVRWDQVDAVKGVGPAKLQILQRTTSLASHE